MTAPSAWAIQQAMTLALSLASRLERDDDTDAEALLAYLRDGGADVDALLVRLLRAAGEAASDAAAAEDRVKALGARMARFRTREQACRQTIAGILDALGIDKWKHAEGTVSLRPGRPGVVITNEAALPPELVRVTVTPDKAAIKARLEAGEVVSGAELANGPPTLTIRSA